MARLPRGGLRQRYMDITGGQFVEIDEQIIAAQAEVLRRTSTTTKTASQLIHDKRHQQMVRRIGQCEQGMAADAIRADAKRQLIKAQGAGGNEQPMPTAKPEPKAEQPKETPKPAKSPEYRHYRFDDLAALVNALHPTERNVWLAGPAGSGKTTAARQLAEIQGLPYEFNGSIDTEYKLSGFVDAQGKIVSTAFRRAWINGGVYLFDECDGSMPGALLAFNAALANGHAAFPDGAIERHPNTIILAAANTWGFGGDANYVGRAKLDAAFLDRFVTLSWDYDETLERKLASNDEWVNIVQQTRKLAREHGAQIVISPRASIKGAQLLAGGLSREQVAEAIFGRYRGHSAWPNVGRVVESWVKGY